MRVPQPDRILILAVSSDSLLPSLGDGIGELSSSQSPINLKSPPHLLPRRAFVVSERFQEKWEPVFRPES